VLHDIGVELGEQLKLKGCPLPVIDGPEFETTTWGNDRIVIEAQGGDSFAAPPVAQAPATNPRQRGIRNIGVQIRIFAHVARKGAQPFEHRRLVDHVLDLVYWAIARVVAARKNRLVMGSGDYYVPRDLAATDVPAGDAYELHFTIDRGIGDLTWKYGKAGEYTIQPATMIGGPLVTFDATAHTITRSAGSWLDDGFVVGMHVTVLGTTSNDGATGPITTITDTVLTFAAGLADEADVEGASLTVGAPETTIEPSLTGT
jgi:hypothetical protein